MSAYVADAGLAAKFADRLVLGHLIAARRRVRSSCAQWRRRRPRR
ncbi:MAG: hypothetical protein ACXWZZ_00560 [Solirubrobacteraceae bacterium]